MKIFFLLFCLAPSAVLCQHEADKWHFGYGAGIDFTSGVPLSFNNSAMLSTEGCASISDPNGNLLFYTNGVEVWNQNHQLMSNGSSLSGHPSSTQSALIVKKPLSDSTYYIFTVGQGGTVSLSYSLVDMTASSGLGAVTVKNSTLMPGMTEKLTGAMHCNGTDVWIVAHKYNSDEFCAFLLTAAGVNTVPVISAGGTMHSSGTATYSTAFGGYMKISPTGRRLGLVIAFPVRTVELFDFDPSTGIVSNSFVVDTSLSEYVYGCEFSTDGSKFYVSDSSPLDQQSTLHQWNLAAGSNTAVQASHAMFQTNSISYLGGMALAPDGRIYVANPSMGSNSVSVINSPDLGGQACNFTSHSFALLTGSCSLGMPNFISANLRQKAVAGFSAGNTVTCNSASFSYTAPAYHPATGFSVTSVEWNFGDPASGAANTTTIHSPGHAFSANGNYTVTLLVHYPCYTDTVRQTLTLNGFPLLQLSGAQTLCVGKSTTFTVTGAVSYSWNGTGGSDTMMFSPATTTVYTVTGADSTGCSSSSSFTVTVDPCSGLREDLHGLSEALVYPNPGGGVFNVKSPVAIKIRVRDGLGRLLFEKNDLQHSGEIDMRACMEGFYFVELFNDQGSKTLRLQNIAH